jgi:cell wall assembly regulator SMI1
MPDYDWPALMQDMTRAVLAWDGLAVLESPEIIAGGWFGHPPASEEQIAAAETRLGVVLPPSYRQFLAFSNGWRTATRFIYRLWPVEQIEWYGIRRRELLEAEEKWRRQYSIVLPPVSDAEYFTYGRGQDSAAYRPEYVPRCLEISDVGNDAVVLLNPQVRTPDGEWEAWFMASWLPGANRYRSFWELMQTER